MFATTDVLYDISDARVLAEVQRTLRYAGYPNEQAYIQTTIQNNCSDVGEIIFSGSHSDNVIILNPKGKSIDENRVTRVITDIINYVYQKYIVSVYGKKDIRSKYTPSQLFYIINMGEQIKVYI